MTISTASVLIRYAAEASDAAESGMFVVTRFSRDAGLTQREHEIFVLLVEGVSMKHIAAELALCDATVRRHAQSIQRKCGGRNQRELMALLGHALAALSPRTA